MNGEPRLQCPGGKAGFSLVELLVVGAILAVLAGIVYASAGGARAKARQAVCIAHLRQIGQAVAMYRQDYAGSDHPGSPAEMGLPASALALRLPRRTGRGPYLSSDDLFYCPAFREGVMPPALLCHYVWKVWNRGAEITSGYPDFAEVVRQRGSDYPLMADLWHNPPADRPGRPTFVLVLRLDGRVSGRHVPSLSKMPAWQW